MNKYDIIDRLNDDDVVAVINEPESEFLVVGETAKVLLGIEESCSKIELAAWTSLESRCGGFMQNPILHMFEVDFNPMHSINRDSYIVVHNLPVLNPVSLDMSDLDSTYAKYTVTASSPDATVVELANLVAVVMYPVTLNHSILCELFNHVHPENMEAVVEKLLGLRPNVRQMKHSSSSIHAVVIATIITTHNQTTNDPMRLSDFEKLLGVINKSPFGVMVVNKLKLLLERLGTDVNKTSVMESFIGFLNVTDKATEETKPFESYEEMMEKTSNDSQKI